MLDELLKQYDEWERERQEILTNLNAAVKSGEVDRQIAEDLRKQLVKWPPIYEPKF